MKLKEKELIELAHKYKMEELEFERKCRLDVERIKHENELETHRIKNADIQRSIMAKKYG
jgi:hypothetical protein